MPAKKKLDDLFTKEADLIAADMDTLNAGSSDQIEAASSDRLICSSAEFIKAVNDGIIKVGRVEDLEGTPMKALADEYGYHSDLSEFYD